MIQIELTDIVSNSDNSRESSPMLQGLGYGILESSNGKPTLFALALGSAEDKKRYCKLLEQHDESLVHLAENIDANGQLTNCRVRKLEGGKYALTFGCRRALAVLYLHAKSEGAKPAKVWATACDGDDTAALIESASENIHLPPSLIDQARLFKRLKDKGLSVAQIAKRYSLGKAPEQNIRHRLRLLDLPDEVQLRVHHGKLSQKAALNLLKDNGGAQTLERSPDTRQRRSLPSPDRTDAALRSLVQSFIDQLKEFAPSVIETEDPDGLAELISEAQQALTQVRYCKPGAGKAA